jgi:hypothetical protein
METINLNGKDFVDKEDYDKISKELENLKTKEPAIKQMDYSTIEPCNIMAIVPFKRNFDFKDGELEITNIGKFKEYSGKLKLEIKNTLKNPEVVIIDKSRYSYEYIQKAMKVSKILLFTESPVFYLRCDDKEFIQDQPLVIKFDSLVFILAPRLESDSQ